MHLRISTSLVVFLLLLGCLSSAEGFRDGVTGVYSLDKDGVGVKIRKLLMDSMLDYDSAGPNPKHDSKGKRPGTGGGKNP